jgi:hypothetical protein
LAALARITRWPSPRPTGTRGHWRCIAANALRPANRCDVAAYARVAHHLGGQSVSRCVSTQSCCNSALLTSLLADALAWWIGTRSSASNHQSGEQNERAMHAVSLNASHQNKHPDSCEVGVPGFQVNTVDFASP